MLQDSSGTSKLNIRLEHSSGSNDRSEDSPDAFDADTLERPNLRFRRQESFIDSLERPRKSKTKNISGSSAKMIPAVSPESPSPAMESAGSNKEDLSLIRQEELPPRGIISFPITFTI